MTVVKYIQHQIKTNDQNTSNLRVGLGHLLVGGRVGVLLRGGRLHGGGVGLGHLRGGGDSKSDRVDNRERSRRSTGESQ
jgi:hypothetical protein